MSVLFQDIVSRFEQFWMVLVQPSALEADAQFRVSLTEVMYAGLRWGGIALLVGVAAHVGISYVSWGGAISWAYTAPGSGEIAILHDVPIVAVGIGMVALSMTECSLSTGRVMEALAVLVVCEASMHDDLLQGPSVAVEYVAMIYLGAVATVPFRPWQMLGIGGGIVGVYLLLAGTGMFIPPAVAEAMSVWEALPFLVMVVIGGSAVGTVLYATRWTQHRIRREAQRELTEAKQRTEEALATVEEQAEQLRELDEMKSRFFANISHELRTPLSLMIGPIDQLLAEDRFDEATTEQMQIVRRNAERLQRLVEQLLDLARYDADRLDLVPQQRQWATFVERVIERFTPMAETEDVTLSVDTAAAEQPVAFDPDHMETVISNLVRNALTYTPSAGTVVVRAAVKEEEVCLRVADSGPGIPLEEQPDLFDRFYRGEGQPHRGGTGIGLALTRVLVTLHDGTVDVESRAGEGSTFTVRWPINQEIGASEAHAAAPKTEAPEARRPEPAGGDGRTGPLTESDQALSGAVPVDRTTILVVEDNADMRRYVRRLLEPRYRVLDASNGQAGLEQARSVLPDLVVADVMMPEMDGFAMLKALRRSHRTEGLPVVMLTARAETTDQVEGLEEGADAYVTKPFDAEVLTTRIQNLLARRQQLRERLQAELRAETDSGKEGLAEEEGEPSSFEEEVRRVIRRYLSDADFSVEQLADEVALSRTYAGAKVKETFGVPPTDLIRTMRLEKGAELIDEGTGTVSEVAYAVGFNSLSYFSRCFKDHFGVSPSVYQKQET